METQIIDLNNGNSAQNTPTAATQIIGGSTTETGVNFTGGLLQVKDKIEGWEVESKLSTISGEADIYLARKDGQKGIIKYYRSVTKPKTEILEKLKNLNHPDIVNVFDFGYHNDRFYEIMEYAEGGSLDTREEDGSYRYLPLSEDKAEGICKEIINSYKTCHEKGIIHRDIKPANIYYKNVKTEEAESGEGEGKKKIYTGDDIVIADFGISSITDEVEELHKTRTGSRTTGYAAPEVLSGIISHKMDYYALGITLWELLTGKDPFVLDNGKRRNDAHLIRDTIEGRIADDILSREPRLSQRMERLIRGLLVIDPDHRWGYEEVTRHLAGETVEVFKKTKKTFNFPIGNVECNTLESLGTAIMNNPEAAKKYIFKGLLKSFLEDDYTDIAKQIELIAEESSAANDHDNGVIKVAYLLNPALPLNINNGFKIQNPDDLIYMLDNAPESVIPLLRDEKSALYTWLDIMGYSDISKEIKDLPLNRMGNTELAGKAEVLLRRKIIKPFKIAKYADFELSTIEQLRNIPKDMQIRIASLVNEKSYEGLIYPWLSLLIPDEEKLSYLLQTKYLGAALKDDNADGNIHAVDEASLAAIDQFEITVSHENKDNYKISWNIEQKDIDIRILVNQKMLPDLKSGKESHIITLPQDEFYEIEALANSGGNWLPCKNKIQINTYKPCEIDIEKSCFKKDEPNPSGTNAIELSVKIAEPIPDNVAAFCYLVRASGKDEKTGGKDLLKAPDLKRITVDVYKRTREIIYKGAAKDEDSYCAYVFTVYNVNGKEIISEPVKRQFIRDLNANIYWKVSKPIIGNIKLLIEVKPNRSMQRLPRLILCISNSDKLLKSYNDPDAVVLLDIPETELDSPQKYYKSEYTVSKEASSQAQKNQKTYLFKITSAENEKYSLHWADGFSGKV